MNDLRRSNGHGKKGFGVLAVQSRRTMIDTKKKISQRLNEGLHISTRILECQIALVLAVVVALLISDIDTYLRGTSVHVSCT